ncbi:MAG: amino acid transporter [Actinomycetota bacterium]
MTRWDGPPAESWAAWSPWDLAERLADLDVPWCVVGGWAIDLALGTTTRTHEDLEIAIPRGDLPAIRRHLDGFVFHAAGAGEVHRLGPTESPPDGVHQHWVLDPVADVWRLDVMTEPGDADTWVFRRDPSIEAPRAAVVGRSPDGIPHLRPHGALLFKAKATRPKDQHDFDVAFGLLGDAERIWLRDALARAHPDHDWIARLDG